MEQSQPIQLNSNTDVQFFASCVRVNSILRSYTKLKIAKIEDKIDALKSSIEKLYRNLKMAKIQKKTREFKERITFNDAFILCQESAYSIYNQLLVDRDIITKHNMGNFSKRMSTSTNIDFDSAYNDALQKHKIVVEINSLEESLIADKYFSYIESIKKMLKMKKSEIGLDILSKINLTINEILDLNKVNISLLNINETLKKEMSIG